MGMGEYVQTYVPCILIQAFIFTDQNAHMCICLPSISEYFFPIMVQQPHESNADEDSLTTKSEGHSLSGACNFDFN